MTIERMPDESARYTTVAVALHWVVAVLIVLNLVIGPFMEGFVEPYRTALARLHESSGITILALTILRVVWRLTHRPPPLDPALSFWERAAAKGVHATLYFAMIALPLLGWAVISANPPQVIVAQAAAHRAGDAPGATPAGQGTAPLKPKRIMLWGIVPLMPIKPIQNIALKPGGKARQHVLHEQLVNAHAVGGYVMMMLLALHLLGALKHEVIDRRPGLSRMWLRRISV